jgi:hypothetical protein
LNPLRSKAMAGLNHQLPEKKGVESKKEKEERRKNR